MKFAIPLLCFACAATMSANMVPNPSFEKINPQTNIPEKWQFSVPKNVTGSVTAENVNVRSGAKAVKLERSGGKGAVQCDQVIRFAKPSAGNRKCTISYHLSAVDVKNAYVVFFAGTPDKFQRQWINLGNISGSFEWKSFTKTVELEAGSTHMALSFRLVGDGTLFVDDVSATTAESELTFRQDFSGAVVPSTLLPENWREQKYIGNENASAISLRQDGKRRVAVQTWHSGAAKSGFVCEKIPSEFAHMDALRASVEFRTSGQGAAVIGVEYRDASGKVLSEALSAPAQSREWKRLEAVFARIPGCTEVRLLLLNAGEGEVCFAATSLTRGEVKDAVNTMSKYFDVKVFPCATSIDQFGEKDVVHMFTDSPIGVAFHFKGDRAKALNPGLEIDVPPALKIADVFTSHPWQYRVETPKITTVVRDGKTYNRYRLDNTMAMRIMVPQEYTFQRKNIVTFMPRDAKNFSPSEHRIFYRLLSNNTADGERSFLIRYLEPMKPTPNPKRFQFMRWDGEDQNFGSDEALLSAIRCLEEANFTWRRRYDDSLPRAREIDRLLAGRQEKWHHFLGGAPSGKLHHYTEAWKSIKPEMAVNADGKVRGHNELCPEFVVNEPRFIPLRDEIIRRNIASRQPRKGDYLILDFEDWYPMDWCFCDRCRRAFATFAKLSNVPSAAEIKKNHTVQWRDFRRTNGVGKIKMIGDVLHKYFPGVTFGDYTYVVDYSQKDYENYFFSVAKDASWNEKYQDMHMPSYYHLVDAKGFDMMKIGRAKLKKEYVPIAAIDGIGYLTKDKVLSPNRFRMMCLNAAATGCHGIGVYPGDHIDGKYFIAADRAMAEIAVAEDYLLDGKPYEKLTVAARPYRSVTTVVGGKKITLQSPRWENYFRFNTHRLGSRVMVSCLNHHDSLIAFADIRATLPPGDYAVTDLIGGKRLLVSDPGAFMVEVPPGDVRFLEISPLKEASKLPMAESQSDTEKRFEQQRRVFLQNNNAAASFQPRREGKFSFELSDINSDSLPEIAVSGGGEKIFIDMERGGSILDWRINNISLCRNLPDHQIAESKLFLPADARQDPAEKSPVRYIASGVKNNAAFVTIERRFKNLPLLETKSYHMNGKQQLTVEHKFTNVGTRPITFAIRVRNVLNPSRTKNCLQSISFAVPRGGKCEQLPPQTETVYPASALDSPTAAGTYGHGKYRLDASVDNLRQFYFWQSPTISTLEWMLNTITLAPGQTNTAGATLKWRNGGFFPAK